MKNLLILMVVCLFTMVNMSSVYADTESTANPRAEKARLNLYVFEETKLVKDFYVWMDKGVKLATDSQAEKVSSNENGGASFTLEKGEHQLSVARSGYENAVINLNVVENENIQIIVTQYPGKSIPHVSIESSQDHIPKKSLRTSMKIVGEPGVLKGRITNTENSEPVAGARLFFSGLATDFETDDDGYFEARVPSSTYSISILHNRFASQTLDNIEVKAGSTVEKKITVTPAGIALKEFVVVAPFIQGSVSSLVDERKETSVISDFVGAEQMSKSGDSDAAAALTRVAGLTLIDGKYAVIRGMEDRYTTVLMNGAVMPSSDPSSASVDLGMFPASILDSIEVQKTYSADMPGAFGGGVIKLRTKTLPEDDYFKVKLSTGGNLGFTGNDVISQESGDTDNLGYDDGGRELPVATVSQQVLTENQAETFNTNYQTKQETANPNIGASVSFGQVFDLSGFKAGYQSYLGYSNKWSYEKGEKYDYSAAGDVLTISDQSDYEKSKYSVDMTGMFTAAIEGDNFEVKSTTAFIRDSYRLTSQSEGYNSEASVYSRNVDLEWSERELLSHQFNGLHKLSRDLKIGWLYGFSTASLNNPDRISYSYDDQISGDTSNLYYADGQTSRSFLELTDESSSLGFNVSWELAPASWLNMKLKGGYSFDATDRISENIEYQIDWFNSVSIPVSIIESQNPNDVLGGNNIGNSGFMFTDFTSPSDRYDASRETSALYSMIETRWFNDFDLIIGVRSESFTQEVNTADSNDGSEIKVDQATDNILPSLLATYRLMKGIQVRVAMAETVNRPSMLELSSSLWYDPESGDTIRGNPRLIESVISHFDARLEFYGNGGNSVSLAYFNKDFKDPIERTLKPSVDNIVTYQNAVSAANSGLEFDFRWDLSFLPIGNNLLAISGNYSVIDSEVVLKSGHTEYSDIRAMQGQSPYTMNFMVTLDNENIGLESGLVLNEIGERITQVSQGDVPHVFEQPFTALDFTLSKEIGGGKFSFKLQNILDSERVYTQGSEVHKKSKPGVSYSMGYGVSF